ncbi:toxin Cry1Ac domain D-VI-related protein [Enterococcus faecium]|uniref:toxin Cry1Ac domain D-VI-related protein n=1 Tax=Enterococcus faecium TaxID=1352 RepID=UPI0039A596B2
MPEQFTCKAQLQEAGTQKINLNSHDSSNNKYNIGVKDKTRSDKHPWSLNTSLTWTDTKNYVSGMYIETSMGTVKENVDGKLEELQNDEVISSSTTLQITNTESEVMHAVDGKVLNGIYNYQFESPQLVISDTSRVPAGTYTGNINWNLSDVPLISGDSIIDQAIQKVDGLFEGNDLSPDVTQQTIDDAKSLVDQLENQAIKKELEGKIDEAQKLLNQKPIVQTLETTVKPDNTLNAGIRMGNGHDRQDLGFQLDKDSIIKIKQTNPNFKENLTLRLLTNDSYTESSIQFSQDEVQLTAKDLSVPFIDTPYNQSNGEKPTVEIVVQGNKRELPKYTTDTNFSSFSEQWNNSSGYALIQGKRFQIFLPPEDKNTVLSTNLNQVINMYDNDIIGFYNELIGLSDTPSNPINQSSVRRYFYKADKHGAGGMYYGGYWAANSKSSAAKWLSDGWGVLHETGHGYQGNFMGVGMPSGEVWNNIYGVIYRYKKLGKEEADQTTWLYDYGRKDQLEKNLAQTINSSNPSYKDQNLRNQLIILSNIIDKAGNEGLQYFYTKYREYANQKGFNASNYPLPDLLVSNLGSPRKYDFSAILTAWGLNVSDKTKNLAKENEYQPVAHLAQVVPDDKLQEAINQLTQNYRLSSVLSLVTNQELSSLNLKSNVTLKFNNQNLLEGEKIRLLNGNTVYKELTLDKEEITLNNVPNGVYSLELESNKGYISSIPYIFVKDDRTIEISLVNYLEEATEAVNQLFEDTACTKIKSTIMQKDIDQVKEKVMKLPENEQKQILLNKLTNAFNQLQEFTFNGYYDVTFATMDVANSIATIRIEARQPHSVYGNKVYATISINRNGTNIYSKEFIGEENNAALTKQVSLEDGDTVTITHKEAKGRLLVNHEYLKNNNNGVYNYIVENGALKLVS